MLIKGRVILNKIYIFHSRMVIVLHRVLQLIYIIVRFYVLTAGSMKMTAFWDIALVVSLM
jgi:hypothetical protein